MFTYRSAVGLLSYSLIDRGDAQFETNLLSRGLREPQESHWHQLKRLCRYLSETRTSRDWLHRPTGDTTTCVLTLWSDSDWAGDRKSRASQSSLFIEADGCPLCSSSRRQAAIATSNCEA